MTQFYFEYLFLYSIKQGKLRGAAGLRRTCLIGLVPSIEEPAQSRPGPALKGVQADVQIFQGVLLKLCGCHFQSHDHDIPGVSILKKQVSGGSFSRHVQVFGFDVHSFWKFKAVHCGLL